MVRLMGAFSVNREGLDRAAVDYAVNVLVEAKRPLLIFPAGTTSRTNDRLMALMEGPGFIARTAAKKRAKKDQKVVVHPIAIKYLYQGDIEKTGNEVLTDLERKLTWTPDPTVPLMERIIKLGNAVLTLKELEFNVQSMPGKTLRERQNNMVDHLMFPLEKEWLGATEPISGGIQSRVKNLRMKIFPEMSRDEIDQAEKDRRWQQLSQTYLAQQIDCYPENYIVDLPSIDRLIDTLEKFEEDLIGQCRIHGKTKVILDVGEAIEVSPKRERGAKSDPLMAAIREQLNGSLEQLQHESRMYEGKIYGQD